MKALLVVLSAVALRSIPLIAGLIVARSNGAARYADFVLAMSLLNLVGSIFQLGVVPQVLSSRADSSRGTFGARAAVVAVWLFAIVAAVLLVSGLFRFGDAAIYAFAAGASLGLLAASLASAMLCRAQQFRTLVWQSGGFLGTSLVGMLAVVTPGVSSVVSLWMAGALIAGAGLVWMHVTARGQTGAWRFPRGGDGEWRAFLRNAAFSAAFGTMMMLGYYLGNVRAVSIEDPQLRGSVALGLQMLALVVFVPGALSSYFVPRFQRLEGRDSSRQFVANAARVYLLLGVGTATACLLMMPVIAMAWDLEVRRESMLIFATLMFAAVLASTNAVFNQLFVSLRAFGAQAIFGCVWVLVVAGVLHWAPPSGTNVGLALVSGYAVLLASLMLYARRGGFSDLWGTHAER